MIVKQITKGVQVSVETFYQPKFSNPLDSAFVFAYKVTIVNNNDYDIQIIRRHWHIVDANASKRQVEGAGIVGEQPKLGPGEMHEYVSYCDLVTDIGKMYGTYLILRLIDQNQFYVKIPEFKLVAPFRLN